MHINGNSDPETALLKAAEQRQPFNTKEALVSSMTSNISYGDSFRLVKVQLPYTPVGKASSANPKMSLLHERESRPFHDYKDNRSFQVLDKRGILPVPNSDDLPLSLKRFGRCLE